MDSIVCIPHPLDRSLSRFEDIIWIAHLLGTIENVWVIGEIFFCPLSRHRSYVPVHIIYLTPIDAVYNKHYSLYMSCQLTSPIHRSVTPLSIVTVHNILYLTPMDAVYKRYSLYMSCQFTLPIQRNVTPLQSKIVRIPWKKFHYDILPSRIFLTTTR